MTSTTDTPHRLLSKRRFIQGGAAVTLGLAVLGVVGWRFQGQVAKAWQDGSFSEEVRSLWLAVSRSVLSHILPADAGRGMAVREEHLERLLQSLSKLLATLPQATQKELQLLLAGLCSFAGRRGLVGLADSWDTASTESVTAALQSLRLSDNALKVQVYQALHDLSCAAYFSSPEHWGALQYPGPVKI